MKMKKVSSMLLVAAMALSLTACGGSGGGSTDEANATGEASNETASSDGAVNLTIWSPTDKEAVEAWWTEKLAQWNEEHPEIQVSREAIDRSDSYAYENKITTAVTSNDLPDIFYVDGPTVSYYAANNIIVPISDYFSEEDISDYVDYNVSQCTNNGELYDISTT